MTVARSVARAVASPVARAVVSGIGGRSYADAVLSIPDLLGYWKFESDSWTPGNTAPVEVPNLVSGSANTLHVDCQDGTDKSAFDGTRTVEPEVVAGPFGIGSFGLHLKGDSRLSAGGTGGFALFNRPAEASPLLSTESFSYGVIFQETDSRVFSADRGQRIVGILTTAGNRGGLTAGHNQTIPQQNLIAYWRESTTSGANQEISLDANDTPLDTWVFACVVHDVLNDEIRVYYNGVLIDTVDTSVWGGSKGETTPFEIVLGCGGRATSARDRCERFSGIIADFWLSTAVLSSDDITALDNNLPF